MSSISKSSSDSKVMTNLEENAGKLNISVKELINQYIKLGLYEDYFYEPEPMTEEKLIKILDRNAKKDRANGIPPRKHKLDSLVRLAEKYRD